MPRTTRNTPRAARHTPHAERHTPHHTLHTRAALGLYLADPHELISSPTCLLMIMVQTHTARAGPHPERRTWTVVSVEGIARAKYVVPTIASVTNTRRQH